ncbi:MAG: hypothetical protein K9K37_12820 [Desulfocapsa sp.]|nr:hypothetical protein [Desulfocapsa sp.]
MKTFLATYGPTIKLLGLVSTITFFLSLLIIPWIIARLPEDFFLHIHDRRIKEDEHPVIFILVLILRYSMGSLLFFAGLFMLFLPGQGILTIVLGLTLLDFPGKQKAVDALLDFRSVQKGLNWIRKKEHKSPFLFSPAKQQNK